MQVELLSGLFYAINIYDIIKQTWFIGVTVNVQRLLCVTTLHFDVRAIVTLQIVSFISHYLIHTVAYHTSADVE